MKSLNILFLIHGSEKSGYAVEPHVGVWVTFVYAKLPVIVEAIDIVFVLNLYRFSFVFVLKLYCSCNVLGIYNISTVLVFSSSRPQC